MTETPARRAARMAWWREARFGLFIHWGPASLAGGDISWCRRGPERRGDHQTVLPPQVPAEVYDKLYLRFDPIRFDAREWVAIAKAAGMKYLVLITKHHDGFSMFHTRYSEHSIEHGPFKRDVVKELAEACRQGGLRFGVYYSTRDWYHPDYLVGDNAKYGEFLHGQVRELLSNYGKIDILWFDHVGGDWKDWRFEDLYRMIYEIQPEIVINNRGAAFVHPPKDQPPPGVAELVRGDFDTPEQHLGSFNTERAWESCMTLVGGVWSYVPDGKMLSLAECIHMLVQCACGDGNLLLNVGPMPDGRIEPRQVERLKEIGGWLGKHGESIYGTRGGPFRPGAWGGSTHRSGAIYLHIVRWDGDSVTLPRLRNRIVRSTCLTGGTASLKQSDEGLIVSVPAAGRDPIDTVVKVEIEGEPELLR